MVSHEETAAENTAAEKSDCKLASADNLSSTLCGIIRFSKNLIR